MSGHGFVGSDAGIRGINQATTCGRGGRKINMSCENGIITDPTNCSQIADIVRSCSLLRAMHTRSQLAVALHMCGCRTVKSRTLWKFMADRGPDTTL